MQERYSHEFMIYLVPRCCSCVVLFTVDLYFSDVVQVAAHCVLELMFLANHAYFSRDFRYNAIVLYIYTIYYF